VLARLVKIYQAPGRLSMGVEKIKLFPEYRGARAMFSSGEIQTTDGNVEQWKKNRPPTKSEIPRGVAGGVALGGEGGVKT